MTKEIIALPTKAIDLAGQIFGRAIALCPVPGEAGKSVTWLCACHCGNVFTRTAHVLKKPRKQHQSCGCLNHRDSHGLHDSRECRSWEAMIQRCTNPNRSRYFDYGGRGITVCTRWLNSLLAFYEDMGERPEGASLDRIDNDGPYSPSNCRWATREEQAQNRRVRARNTKIITHASQSLTISEWAQHLGITDAALRGRFARGWPLERALQPRAQLHDPS